LDRLAIGQDSELAEWLSNLGTIVGITTPFVVDWVATNGDRKALREDAVVVGQALALNGVLNTATKYIVQRPLPETYAGVVPNRQGKARGYRAFYSGHVSSLATALAAGGIAVRIRHGRLPWRWPWILSTALTGLVGLGRIFSGKHFPSDVLVAAPVGAAIGAVPLVHARRGGPKENMGQIPRGKAVAGCGPPTAVTAADRTEPTESARSRKFQSRAKRRNSGFSISLPPSGRRSATITAYI
jgi:membrane-associated phospholipid phosphatase